MHPSTILQRQNSIVAIRLLSGVLCCILCCIIAYPAAAQLKDSVALLKTINIGAVKTPGNYTSIAPLQSLSKETLQQLNAQSVGDAARYFSGVLIKDYGGIGGLKTISVRSLGAANTAVIYDGIPVSELQTGQVDLSRFSTTFVQSLVLQQGDFQYALVPARSYASAAALAISSNTFAATNFTRGNWQAGIKAGSFGLVQPFAGIYQPLKKNTIISVNAEALYSKGDYPFSINNGSFSSKSRRSNSAIKSLQGEINLLKQFQDSSTLQLKTGVYTSARGLPGAIVFFNDRSVQRLQNTDVFAQGRYQKKMRATALLFAAKYSHTHTRYTDPDFLNNQGGLNNYYNQQEVYLTAAANHTLTKDLLLSVASDVAITTLAANVKNFVSPRRISVWENLALAYTRGSWRLNTTLLYTGIDDKTKTGLAATARNKFTPAIAMSFSPTAQSPWLFRVFYKAIYRMPTFNDLYYTLVGSVSLKPEYAKQYNAGIIYSKQLNTAIKKISLSADAYYNEITDKIIAVPSQNLFVWTMLNLGKVCIKGIDVNAEVSGQTAPLAGWLARIAYTWQRAQDITDKNSSVYKNRIPYTPDHSGSGLASFHYKDWEAGYSILFSGTRFALGENSAFNELPGWLTQDVFASRLVKFNHCTMRIKAALDNFSDERFDIVRYYPMPGRSFTISLLFNHL